MKLGGYDVEFAHVSKRGVTMANVVVEGRAFTGIAECSRLDNFSRIAGRKVALAQALKHSGLPKTERTLVWEDFKLAVRYE